MNHYKKSKAREIHTYKHRQVASISVVRHSEKRNGGGIKVIQNSCTNVCIVIIQFSINNHLMFTRIFHNDYTFTDLFHLMGRKINKVRNNEREEVDGLPDAAAAA